MHGIEPETVDVVVANPQLSVLGGPLPHAFRLVVERVAPERAVLRRAVGRECGQRLVPGTDVVVDDVEDDAEAGGMRRPGGF